MAKSSLMIYTALVWWCYFTNTPATSLTDETDQLPLMAFKAATQDPYGSLSSWNETLHYCNWNGISCSRRHPDRVTSLKLSSKGLIGSLSPHIGNLSFLKIIILQNNSFHGQIPSDIGRLFRLQYVDFSNNSFGGEIPNNLSHCSNLIYLNLIDNHLTGSIPPELGSLSKLGYLYLAINKLSGTIPPSIGNLSSLIGISFIYCGLQGEIPEEMYQLRALEFFQLSNNNLSGKIPYGLYNISSITYFSLSYNQLQGSIPPDIGFKLPKLLVLNFAKNLLSGRIPVSLSNASGLEEIYFHANNFTGPMPKDLGKLLNLIDMSFSNNRIQDDISFITSLTNCSRLEVIQVERNLLTGKLPDSIGNLSSQIWRISIHDNQLHGSIPSGIENLLNLSVVVMAMNYLTGPIPTVIGKLRKLQELYLFTNHFTEELPSSLGNLSLLNSLFLNQNNIYGRIPPSLGKCHNLLELDLSHNSLNGSIPPDIMSLSSISISLDLAHNSLTGTLPSKVGSLKNLAILNVSYNRLSGALPKSLSNCLSLELLHLEGNSFDGEIPQSLSALKSLQAIDLSQNNISGLIPHFLAELRLQKLNLSFNRLYGEVPQRGVFRNESAISIIGNKDLCGGIADLKLPPCPSSNSTKTSSLLLVKVVIPVVSFVVICLTLLVCYFIFGRNKFSSKKGTLLPPLKNQFLRVSYADLLKATNGFSKDNLIGLGNSGTVYKGIFHDQTQMMVAVKVLNLQHREASNSFVLECKALRTVRHRNLLKILSVCSSVDFQGNEFKALIYEFMANGSLEKWLHSVGVGEDVHQEESKNLKLIQRMNIAIDIAFALEYLHHGCESMIVHGDLKPSNILLDDDMTAQVGDFGLAKVVSTISSEYQSDSIAVKGTVGYVAPEYGMGGMISIQGDVYSYGIIVLEMFTNKNPTDDAFKDGLSLHTFAKNALPDQVLEIVDPRIILEHDSTSSFKDCIISILNIGVSCSMERPRDRMKMGDVVSELCKIKKFYTEEVLNQQTSITFQFEE